MLRRRIIFSILVATALVNGCLEPYDPPTVKNNPDFIVVDGFINVKNGSAEVKLSHSVPLSSTDVPAMEDGATVLLQDEIGNDYVLYNALSGVYTASSLPLDASKKYRLYFKTSSNKEYQSDFVTFKTAPAIDSITYHVDDQNILNINVNAHDPSGKTRFYRWHYIETFEYKSHFSPGYVVRNGTVYQRTPEEDISICWRTNQATKIIVGSTQRLAEDVVSQFNLLKIESTDLRLTKKYSILVQQSALNEDAYNYWLNVQKTTESLGGLFDPMPSQVVGNIHCITNPAEEVIGFFSGGYVTEKRIFISQSDLPEDFSTYSDYCPIDTINLSNVSSLGDETPLISPVYPPGFPVIIGYTTSLRSCIDCRILGKGTTTKPDFWE